MRKTKKKKEIENHDYSEEMTENAEISFPYSFSRSMHKLLILFMKPLITLFYKCIIAI